MTETEVGYGIVGAGRLATALVGRLVNAGAAPGIVCSRSSDRAAALASSSGWALAASPLEVAARSRLTLLCVADGDLARVVGELTRGLDRGARVVAHCAGSQGLEPLLGLRQLGCAVGVFHPLAPVPDGDPACLDGTFISIEADSEARSELLELAAMIGCAVIELGEVDRSLYHAAAVFAGVLPVLLELVAERLGAAAGADPVLAAGLRALHEASARNVLRLGPELGLSGPQQRRDGATVAAHLAALSRVDPRLAHLYQLIQEAARPVPADRTGTGG
ncbi:MAG TPA: DUF2520 domain-containing protein [Candidatus Dormibacteraeota bacterium]|nr:DUF2520 domain-containing protein [Candidatus Dormibacteraeota bacterium]